MVQVVTIVRLVAGVQFSFYPSRNHDQCRNWCAILTGLDWFLTADQSVWFIDARNNPIDLVVLPYCRLTFNCLPRGEPLT